MTDIVPADEAPVLDYLRDATKGCVNAVRFAEQSVRSARQFAMLENEVLIDRATGVRYKDLANPTEDGLLRLKYVKAYHEMKVREATLAMDMMKRAGDFYKLVLELDPASAKTAHEDGGPTADSPIARMREYAQSVKPHGNTMARINDRRVAVEKEAERLIAEEEKKEAAAE